MDFLTIEECFYKIRNGANIKQGKTKGGYPITRIETISNDRFNRDKMGYAGITNLGKYADYILEDEDLLMSHINSTQYLGRTVLYKNQNDEKIIHGMNLLALKAKRNVIEPAYARYCFYSQYFRNQIAKITKKSVNQASFSVSDLKKIKIKVPSLKEQYRIICLFDKVNGIIDNYQSVLQKLDELVKARFVEMFGNPVINSRKWKTEELNSIAPISNFSGNLEDKVWLLNLDMIEPQTGRIIDYLYVSIDEVGSSTCKFDTDNVLYSKLRPYLNKVVIPDRSGYATSELVPLRPKKSKLNRVYLAFLLRSNEFVNMINEKVAGAKMPRVSMTELKKFRVPVPPIELQNEFAEFTKQVDKSREIIQKKIDTYQELFDKLMQEYFG